MRGILSAPTGKIYMTEIGDNLRLPIKSIMFGPNHFSNIGKHSLSNFLEKNGYKRGEVKIKRSALSIR